MRPKKQEARSGHASTWKSVQQYNTLLTVLCPARCVSCFTSPYRLMYKVCFFLIMTFYFRVKVSTRKELLPSPTFWTSRKPQAVVTGAIPSPPRHVPLFGTGTRFSIPTLLHVGDVSFSSGLCCLVSSMLSSIMVIFDVFWRPLASFGDEAPKRATTCCVS